MHNVAGPPYSDGGAILGQVVVGANEPYLGEDDEGSVGLLGPNAGLINAWYTNLAWDPTLTGRNELKEGNNGAKGEKEEPSNSNIVRGVKDKDAERNVTATRSNWREPIRPIRQNTVSRQDGKKQKVVNDIDKRNTTKSWSNSLDRVNQAFSKSINRNFKKPISRNWRKSSTTSNSKTNGARAVATKSGHKISNPEANKSSNLNKPSASAVATTRGVKAERTIYGKVNWRESARKRFQQMKSQVC